jgi:predicted O-methyltransferase YrrM
VTAAGASARPLVVPRHRLTEAMAASMMIIAAIIATYTSLQLLLLLTTPVSARALGDGVDVGAKSHVDDIYRYNSPVPVMSGRDLMPLLVNISGFKSIAEVGVQAGVFSELLLRKSGPQIQSYILVDIWAEQKHYDDGANVNNTLQQKLYEQTLERVAPYKEKTRVMRMYSLQAAAILQKELEQSKRTVPSAQSHTPLTEQLDLVYLDARHDYCGCLEDIVAWWPLLKENGILCGHDFMWKNPEWHMCANGSVIPGGVRAAVMDWARDNDLQVLFVVLDHSSFRGV